MGGKTWWQKTGTWLNSHKERPRRVPTPIGPMRVAMQVVVEAARQSYLERLSGQQRNKEREREREQKDEDDLLGLLVTLIEVE